MNKADLQKAIDILESGLTTIDGEWCAWCSKTLISKAGIHDCELTRVTEALRQALAEPEQDKRTTVADLRDAMWLDPECADRGACQSLKFKCPAPTPRKPVELTDAEIDELLPEPDGSAEINPVRVTTEDGWPAVEYEEVHAWSKPLVLAIARAVIVAYEKKLGEQP